MGWSLIFVVEGEISFLLLSIIKIILIIGIEVGVEIVGCDDFGVLVIIFEGVKSWFVAINNVVAERVRNIIFVTWSAIVSACSVTCCSVWRWHVIIEIEGGILFLGIEIIVVSAASREGIMIRALVAKLIVVVLWLLCRIIILLGLIILV